MIATSIQQRCKMKKFQMSGNNWFLTLSKVEGRMEIQDILGGGQKGQKFLCLRVLTDWGWIARAWKLFEVQQVQDAKVRMKFWRMKTMNRYWSISRCSDSVLSTSGRCQLGGLSTMWREVRISCLQLSGSIDGGGVQT